MQILVTNLTEETRIYFGIEFAPDETKELFDLGVTQVQLLQDDLLIPDWAKGLININDGLQDIVSSNQLISLLKGSFSSLRSTDNRIIVKPNVRPVNTTGYFTSRDDNVAIPGDVGNGENLIEVDHKIGDPATVTITQKFNVESNRSWVFEGYLKYSNALFDRFCFYISTVATPFTEMAGTNFLRYPGKKIILPAMGNGDVSLDLNNLTTLVSVVPKTDSGLYPSAYWDADYNSTTGKYENLTPNLTGEGKYNIFYEEVTLKRYINNVGLIGDGFFKFETTDPSELASNLKCNYMFTTTGDDHDWRAIVFISMFREKGV